MMKKGLIILLWPLWCLIPVLCTDPGCKSMVLGPDEGMDEFVYPLGDAECPYLWLKSTSKKSGYSISFHFQNAPSNPPKHTIRDIHWHLGMVKRSVENASMIIVKVDNEEVARGNSKLTITSTVKVKWIRWDNNYTFPEQFAKMNRRGRKKGNDGPKGREASRLEENNKDDAQAEEEEGEEGEFGVAMMLVLSMLAVEIVLVMVVMVVVIVLCCRKRGPETKGRWVVERELTVPNSASINTQFYSA